MKHIRFFLLFFLALCLLSLFNLVPLRAQPNASAANKLNPERVIAALDRGDIDNAVQQVELGWKQQYEEYYEGKLTSQLLSAEQIAERLAQIERLSGKRTALIYAIPTPKQLELILLPPHSRPVHRRITDANRQSLTDLAQSYRMAMVNRLSDASDYLPPAQQLYSWLVKPLEADLKAQQIETLIFCLGTGLRSLPLAALHDGKQFLVENYSLGIIPAFNLLDPRPTILTGLKVLAMGASEFREEAPLPAVPIELSTITRSLWQGESLLNQDFTIENLKARRKAYPFGIVHLATHATVASGGVQESYIQFWDAKLRLNQLKQLDLRQPVVQLLVLSACRTALGNPQAELGFAGLAVQSGAKASLASLWSVSDAGTLALMSSFYRQLRSSPIKTEALRQAQVQMLKGQLKLQNSPALRAVDRRSLPQELMADATADLSHPYYWAAFTMIGNPW